LNDTASIMTFGAIHCPADHIRKISLDITSLKREYSCTGEIKWTKVSIKNLAFYKALIEYFMTDDNLKFRSLIVRNKTELDHGIFNDGEHDNFYYKMYYYLLRNIVEKKNNNSYEIFIDIKDTRSSEKVKELRKVLNYSLYDFEMYRIQRIQQIRSHESNILQLCDFLLGAVTYANRNLGTSEAKLAITKEISTKYRVCLTESTTPWEEKFNLFHFKPRGPVGC